MEAGVMTFVAHCTFASGSKGNHEKTIFAVFTFERHLEKIEQDACLGKSKGKERRWKDSPWLIGFAIDKCTRRLILLNC